MTTKALLIVSAVVELGAGLALLCCPSVMVTLLIGAALETSVALTVARVGGAGLLALSVACWLARDDSHSRAAKGLIAAMLIYDVAAAAVLADAGIRDGLNGPALWLAVVLHTAMSVWCAMCLRR